MHVYGMLLNGEVRPGRSAVRPLVNPATGETFAQLAAANAEDLDESVTAATRAFRGSGWRTSAPLDRSRVLFRAAEIMRERVEEIAVTETRNIGRPIRETRSNVVLGADDLAFYASATTHLRGATIPMGEGTLDYTLREPLGVCGLIVPWNNPINLFTRKVAPALAAGNAVVVKPATATPATALIIGEILEEAGLPPGQLNIIPGSGGEVGDRLVGHPGIAKVSFTGATPTGKGVMRSVAERVAQVSLELGGKSPALVFADADVTAAAHGCVRSMFTNAGQTCTARSRILVEASIFDEFLAAFVNEVKALRVGDPMDVATEIGPLVSKEQRNSVLGYVERAVIAGAQLATGGGSLEGGEYASGFYVEPTVVVDVDDDMEIVCEEVFGPVVVVDRFDSETEAITRSNNSSFGLAATIWTQNLSRAHRVAAQLEAGTVTVNTAKVSHAYAPFGGYKESGMGRELGVEGLLEYLQVKNVVVAIDS